MKELIQNINIPGVDDLEPLKSWPFLASLALVLITLGVLISLLARVSLKGRKRTYNDIADPAPSVNLLKCAESSMDFSERVWVSTADYWPVNFRMVDNCKRALDRAGITIPYPQMDIHMK